MADLQDEGAGLRAALLFLTGALTLWAGYTELKRYRARRFGAPRLSSGTYPGKIVRDSATFGRMPQGVVLNPNVGDETLAAALARVRSKTGLPRRQTVEMRTVEERINEIGRLIREGSLDDDIKAAAGAVLSRKCGEKWCVGPKNYAAESDAMFEAVVDPKSPIAMRYTLDHPTVDEFGSATRGLRMRTGDCLPGETKLLTPSGFKPIVDVRPGDVVMGDGQWVKVTQWWDKGVLKVRGLNLNTGSQLVCTDEHQLFVVPKRYYSRDTELGRSTGKLAGQRGEEVEMLAGDVSEGDHLLTLARVPEGRLQLAADDAWLLGVFVADGWVEYREDGTPFRVAVSGKDGHPKEEQKRRVQAIVAAHGWTSTWNARYIRFTPDAVWLANFAACGRGAPNKRIPTLDVTVNSAGGILAGLAADASITNSGTLTYNTTSVELALQIRVLHRMLGERTNIHRIDEHGGLGKNPIYRVSLVRSVRTDGRRTSEFAMVKDVDPDLGDEHVYDIEVEGHRFYLPEHDVIVHNCDDLSIYLGSLIASQGHRPEIVIMQAKGASNWSHIFLREPINLDDGVSKGGARYRYLDPSMQSATGWQPAGWVPPGVEAALSGRPGIGITSKARAYRLF